MKAGIASGQIKTKQSLQRLLQRVQRLKDPLSVKRYLLEAQQCGDQALYAEAVDHVRKSGFLEEIKTARERELTARYLLLHLEKIPEASEQQRKALEDYVHQQGWKNLYGHDRRMYRLLRKGAERYNATRTAAHAPMTSTARRYPPRQDDPEPLIL